MSKAWTQPHPLYGSARCRSIRRSGSSCPRPHCPKPPVDPPRAESQVDCDIFEVIPFYAKPRAIHSAFPRQLTTAAASNMSFGLGNGCLFFAFELPKTVLQSMYCVTIEDK